MHKRYSFKSIIFTTSFMLLVYACRQPGNTSASEQDMKEDNALSTNEKDDPLV